MHNGKLFLLSILAISVSGCQECLNDPCIQNDFGVHGGRSDTLGNPTGNRITDVTASGPCTVNTRRYDCELAVGCDDVAFTGTGVGTCHIEGRASVTGAFTVDVEYTSCTLQCGGNAVFVTDHWGLYLQNDSSPDAGRD